MPGEGDMKARLVYEDVVMGLKELMKERKILYYDVVEFDIGCNPRFVQRYAPSLKPQPDFITLSKAELARLRRWKEWQKMRAWLKGCDDQRADLEVDEQIGDSITIVTLDLLKVGRYRAKQRETWLAWGAERFHRSLNELEVANRGTLGTKLKPVLNQLQGIERGDGLGQMVSHPALDEYLIGELLANRADASNYMAGASKLSQLLMTTNKSHGIADASEPSQLLITTNTSQYMRDESEPSQSLTTINTSQEMPDVHRLSEEVNNVSHDVPQMSHKKEELLVSVPSSAKIV
ncbi:hypothetical protein FGB62_359g00 [Gracilaria domingensis]|nr:hypothetical protein FGB62_359g00 [Gracilaria domingensis]